MHVFISYKRDDFTDSAFLAELERHLELANITFWRDHRIQPGDNWEVEIDQAIDDSFACLLLLSPNASASQYVTYEWTRALTLGKKVIPLLLESNAAVHPRLQKTQFVDFTQDSEFTWELLVARLHTVQNDLKQKLNQQQTDNERASHKLFDTLKSMYSIRETEVTAEQLISELRANHFISLSEYAILLDLIRRNQES